MLLQPQPALRRAPRLESRRRGLGLVLIGAALGLSHCDGSSPRSAGSAGSASSLPPASTSAAAVAISAPPSDAASAPTASVPASASAANEAPGVAPIRALQSDAALHPEAHEGKPHRLEGVYVGVKKWNIGALVGDSYHAQYVDDVIVADTKDANKDDRSHTILCEMNKWSPPAGLALFDAVVIEGKAYTDPPAGGRKLVLGNCTLTKKSP